MCTNSEKSWRLILALHLEPFGALSPIYSESDWLHVPPILFVPLLVVWCSIKQLQQLRPFPCSVIDVQSLDSKPTK